MPAIIRESLLNQRTTSTAHRKLGDSQIQESMA